MVLWQVCALSACHRNLRRDIALLGVSSVWQVYTWTSLQIPLVFRKT